MRKVVIAAGGTGGHIFPGMAVGEKFAAAGFDVHWLGSEIGIEKNIVPKRFSFHTVAIYQLRGKGLKAKLFLPWRLCYATVQAMRVLRALKPAVVVSMGGFVAGPGSLAAKILGYPLVIHEQNARAGLTNRYLSKIANVVLQAFPDSFPTHKREISVVGNPVREAILKLAEPLARLATHTGPLRILILGGSLGAQAINTLIVEWLAQCHYTNDISVRHQTGEKNFASVKAAYASGHKAVKIEAFIEDMSEALAWADLVICRAGALTVSEVAAVGIASILIPMPQAVDNHQFYNAKYLSDHEAAILLEQKDASAESLDRVIRKFLEHRDLILQFSLKARELAQRDSADLILSRALA